MKDYNDNAIVFLAFFFNFFYLPWSEGLQTLMNARANISKFLYVGVILIVTHGTFYLFDVDFSCMVMTPSAKAERPHLKE